MNPPRRYNLTEPGEHRRLLIELSGYLGQDMDCRKAFLEDGTDRKGREYALQALDELRSRQTHSGEVEKPKEDDDFKDFADSWGL